MNPFAALIRQDEPQPTRPRQANPVRTFGGRFRAVPNKWNLPPIECEIMRLMVDEWLTQQEVADRLCRGYKTIATHCARIREKMGARHQSHALVLWDRYFRPQPVVFTVAEAI